MIDRWRDRDDCWCDHDDDFYEEEKPTCPNCGEVVPPDHLETDSGDCISCEDKRYDERREAEAQEETYALCLTGLQPKPKKRKRKK